MSKKKKIILFSVCCLAIIISSAIFFKFFYKMSGDNENGKLYLELLPANIRNVIGYEATIKNEKDKEIISKKLRYVHGDTETDSCDDTYGKWEIKNYKFQYERTGEGVSAFIFERSYTVIRLHLYVEVISDELGLIQLEIINPIETMEKGEEYTFKVNRSPLKGTKLAWFVFNYDKKNPEVLKINHNSALVSGNEATITALEYGRAYLKLYFYRGINVIIAKDYQITVPCLAEKMELIDDWDVIYLHEFRHLLKINYQPSYATNENYTVTFDNPILEVDIREPDAIWFKPLGVGNVTVTVTTDNGVSATKEYEVIKR